MPDISTRSKNEAKDAVYDEANARDTQTCEGVGRLESCFDGE
jgi:hypothetical protein